MERSINVLERIASSLDRRDEIPNQTLAHDIIQAEDRKAVEILKDGLYSRERAIQNDCIKVLYEIGYKRPDLILNCFEDFIEQLHADNNRLQWGAMIALSTLSRLESNELYKELPAIIKVAEKGSVITKDNAINIMIELGKTSGYRNKVFVLLIEQLLKSPINQFPKYAEQTLILVNSSNKVEFVNTVSSRLSDLVKESHINRVKKVLRKVHNI